jgi:hypothetical protein
MFFEDQLPLITSRPYIIWRSHSCFRHVLTTYCSDFIGIAYIFSLRKSITLYINTHGHPRCPIWCLVHFRILIGLFWVRNCTSAWTGFSIVTELFLEFEETQGKSLIKKSILSFPYVICHSKWLPVKSMHNLLRFVCPQGCLRAAVSTIRRRVRLLFALSLINEFLRVFP